MLAHSGLALITEKLQNQRLEETTCSPTLPVTQSNPARKIYQQQSGLTVKGKNVWSISLESERQGRYEYASEDIVNSSAPRFLENVNTSCTNVCPHKKPRYICNICDSFPSTHMAPPKKKHCRSLSVPPDSLTVFSAPIRDNDGKIWKPVAMIPHSNSDDHYKEKNLHPVVFTGDSSKWLSRLSSGCKLLPVVPSPTSIDSGHCTTSDLQTPPESPIPRPASAASDTSFSSQSSSAWYDYNSPMRNRMRALENRSLSCEDRISTSSSTNSMPCVHDSMEPSKCCDSRTGQDSGNNKSISSNNSSSNIPRCHSQPCVLHHRRCGQKRRRNCDRPTLNFIKMTETAYPRNSSLRSKSTNIPVNDQQTNLPLHQMFSKSLAFGLNPIASSPLDTEFPVAVSHLIDFHLNATSSRTISPDYTSSNFLPQIITKNQREEEEYEDGNDCNCHDGLADDGVGLFPGNDLDIEQIENH